MHPSTYKCFYKSKIFRKLCLQFGGLLRRKRGAFLTHSMLAFYSLNAHVKLHLKSFSRSHLYCHFNI